MTRAIDIFFDRSLLSRFALFALGLLSLSFYAQISVAQTGADVAPALPMESRLPAGYAAVEQTGSKPIPADSQPWPTRLGPAEIKSDNGAVRLEFAAQLLATWLNRDHGPGESRENLFEVEPRRIRWYLKGRWLGDRLRFGVQINTTPQLPELLDFWGEWRFFEQLQMQVGQFKEPFTRYRQGSFSETLLADWANVVDYFGADRQLGVMLHNKASQSRFEYALAVFSGQNMRASRGETQSKTVYGEKLDDPSFLPRDKGILIDEWHPELEARVQYNSPGAEPYKLSDDKRSGPRHVESLSAAWDNASNLSGVDGKKIDRKRDEEATRDLLLRISPELLFKAWGLALHLGGYAGWAEMTQDGENRPAMLGTLAEAAYRFNRFWEAAACFSRVDFLQAYRRDARERAARLIAEEPRASDRAQLQDRYEDAGRIKATQEMLLGLNVYIVGDDLKTQTDFGWLREYRDDGGRDDWRWRLLMQLAF